MAASAYRKVLLWSVAISLVALVVYVRSVMSQAGPVSTLPVTLYAITFPVVLAFLLAMVWRHNHSAYQRQYADWDRSFICQRCGTVSQHDFGTPFRLPEAPDKEPRIVIPTLLTATQFLKPFQARGGTGYKL